MRQIVRLALALMLLQGLGAQAAEEETIRRISVSGTVELKTAPDQIVWRISLKETDKDLLAAKKRSDEKIKSVLALQEKLGLAEGDIETGQVRVEREYERDERGERGDFKHFVVNRRVTIRQRDLKRFDEFLDSMISSAEMEVDFSFESSRMDEIRAEARLKAMQVAKEKAEAMAGAVGAKIGRVLTIDEHAQGDRSRSYQTNVLSPESRPTVDVASDTFIPGAIPVQVTVFVTFELE